jgi:hypothetical protein
VDTYTATCRTEDCPNAGYPIELSWDGTPLDAVICGVCGQPITELTPDPTAAEGVRANGDAD